ncbi:MAG: hypothetical protein KAS07_01520 [Candidatus Pacebacteria bacterium]|nr:hypothetical protein [Candidatus Paceibacterota bacterium]
MLDNELIGNTISIITSLSLSFVVLIGVFAVFFGYAWKTSKGKSVALIVGILVSGVLHSALIETRLYQSIFSENAQSFILELIVFGVLIVATTFIFKSFCKGVYSKNRTRQLLQMGAFAVVAEGLFITQAYRLLEIETLYNLSFGADFVFGSEYSFLAWISAALIVLFIIRGHK